MGGSRHATSVLLLLLFCFYECYDTTGRFCLFLLSSGIFSTLLPTFRLTQMASIKLKDRHSYAKTTTYTDLTVNRYHDFAIVNVPLRLLFCEIHETRSLPNLHIEIDHAGLPLNVTHLCCPISSTFALFILSLFSSCHTG
ncbi:hypothetical protein B0T09DRAFT_93258 [Sordaria sp. MPI-SDFR-AT-0083]|nr:hypothetical protein B0T09DRAFT_93258 [Sordaria sp. MPI-SDFR-AT-0083]